MEVSQVQNFFNQFLAQYDVEGMDDIWETQSSIFHEFWKGKILNKSYKELTTPDTDAIIRLIDSKARGHQKSDQVVAHVGLYQGLWERLFNDLKNKPDIQKTLDEIFNTNDEESLVRLVNHLVKENEKNKNGLTGKKGNALNALLFLNSPSKFVSCVSLAHRYQILKAFGLAEPESYKNYGEQIIYSSRDIITGFKDKLSITAEPRTISQFVYSANVKVLWQSDDESPEVLTQEFKEEAAETSEMDFAMEKHLEEFLVRNWETTELGKHYELIEEDGEVVSPQYPTDVGPMDLLVRDKETKDYVVIELKKGQTSDDTVGQIARYMGWVKKNLAKSESVKGIIIAGANDKRLQYALIMLPDVKLLIYKVGFALAKAEKI